MGGQPRARRNSALPIGMRVRDGYYSYACPVTKREYGLGRDRRNAIEQVREVRQQLADSPATRKRLFVQQDGAELMTPAQILASAMTLTDCCGVYFLIHVGEIVYVGSSLDCYERINRHVRDGEKTFDSWSFVPAARDQRLLVEASYIVAMSPRYNKSLPNFSANRRVAGMAIGEPEFYHE